MPCGLPGPCTSGQIGDWPRIFRSAPCVLARGVSSRRLVVKTSGRSPAFRDSADEIAQSLVPASLPFAADDAGVARLHQSILESGSWPPAITMHVRIAAGVTSGARWLSRKRTSSYQGETAVHEKCVAKGCDVSFAHSDRRVGSAAGVCMEPGEANSAAGLERRSVSNRNRAHRVLDCQRKRLFLSLSEG